MIFGDVQKSTYIVEAIGGGCAFLDYDNDGWMDIFMVCGTRLGGAPPGATNRLYKNNRDGTFTDVTENAGLHHVGWGTAYVSAITTTTVTTICFVPILDRTGFTATMATEHSPM